MIGDQEIDIDALAKKLARTTPVKAEDIDIDALARHLIESTDPGFKEYAVGLPKAVAKGAMDATGAGLVGLGKIGEMVSGDAVGQGLVSAGESVQRAAPQPDPRIEGDLITRTASGIGSSVPIIGGTLATGGLGGGPLAMAATAGGTSMLMEGGGGYQEAKARGADESTARTAMLLTMPLGALDALGPETGQAFRLAKVIRPARAAIERAGLTGLVDSVLSVPGRIAERSALGGMALSSGVELAQETIQGKGEVIAQQLAGTIKSDEEAKSLWDVAQSDGFPAALGSAFTEAVTQWITGGHARSHALKTGASADQGGAALGGEANLKGQSTEAPAPTADDRAARVIDLPEDDVRSAVDKLVRDPTVQPKGEDAASLPLPTIFEPAKHIADEAGAVGLRVVEVSAPGYENWEGYYDPSTGIAVVNADLPDDMKRRQVVRHEMVHFLEQNHPEVYAEWNAAVKAVAPELQAGIARTRTKTEAALGNKIAPEAATGEANAEIRQNSPTLEDIATLHPDIAAKIAAHSPGLLRRLADALIDFAHALGLTKSRSVSALTRDLQKIIAEHGTSTEQALGAKRGMALFAKLAELQKAIRLEVPVAQPTNRTSVDFRQRLDLPGVESDASFPKPLTRVRVKGKPGADFVPGADEPVVVRPEPPKPPPPPPEPTEAERVYAAKEGVRRAGLERLSALETRIGQLPPGKRRTAVEREAGELRAALEEVRRQDALEAPKAVGDVVQLPSGERGRVVSVKGDILKVQVDAVRTDLPEDVTLGLPAQKVRTVTAGVAELVSRKGATAPGPEAPSAHQQKAAAKEEPVPRKLPFGTPKAPAEKSANPANPKPRESHREKGAPSKSAGLPFETAKGGHAEGEKITAKLPVVYADERLKDSDTRAALVSMARWEAGWEQEGGKLIFTEDAGGKREVTGRTKWIAKADWWASRPEDARLNERETREAVRKANAGEKLTAEESRLIQHMLDASETRSEVVGEGSFTGFLMSGLSDEEMARREREAIQNEGEPVEDDTSSSLPFARPTPPVTGSVLANITRRWGADNAERQTARISTDENVRGFQAGVRNAVLDRPLMKQQSRAAWRKQAETELRARPKELREDLIDKWRSNQILEPWEQIAWALMTEKAAKRMFRTMSVEDTKEAIKLETMIEMYRTSQARGMAAYVDATKQWSSGAEAFTAVVTKARTKTREKIEALRKLMLEPAPDEIQFAREKELDALLVEEVAVTQKVIAELRKAGLDPDLVTIDYFRDPYIFARAARIAATTKSTKRDVYLEWRVAAMLSFPPTQMANIAGNTAHIGYRGVLGRIATATANLAARDPNAASFGELPHYIGAMLSALPEAGRNWLMAMQTELPAMDVKLANQGVDIPFLSTQVDALEAGKQAIPGWIGRIMRFPSTTTLLAFDEFFKTLAYHSEAVSQAYRIAKAEGYDGAALRGRIDELIADTTSPLHLKAWQESRVLLFQDTEKSPMLRAIMALRRGADDAAKVPLGSILFPFVRTPYRIFTRGMAIPFSPVVAVHHALTGKWKNEPGLREHDIGASILGLAVVLGIASMIGDDDDPWITGSTSMNRGQRELDQRSFPPMSFRVGNSWFSYARIEPFATAFATIIDSVRDWSHHPQESTPERVMSTTGALVQSVTQQAGDKTFLRTFGEIVKLQQEAQQGNLGGAVTDFGVDTLFTPMIPNAIRGTLRASDEYMRANPSRSLDDEGVAERALKAAPYKALPIGSLAPQIKYDLWGRPIERPGFAFVERVLSPMMRQGEVDHVVAADLAIRRWNTLVESGQRPDGKKYLPLAPSYTSRGHKWNDEEYATLCRESGKLAAQRIRDGYVLDYENPSQEDIDAIRDALHDAQTEVRDRLFYERSRR